MVQKITKRLRLDFDKIPKSAKDDVKREIGEFVVDKIQQLMDSSRSPVKDVGPFKPLKKGGKSILFESGDMRSQIQFEEYRDGIEVGIFDSGEAQKADNHNKNSAKSLGTAVPKRQFIPYKDQDFKDVITKGIEAILESNRVRDDG